MSVAAGPAIDHRQPVIKALDFDEHGFLRDPKKWSRNIAKQIAEMDDVGPMTPDHWAILYSLREHYFANNTAPLMASVCRTAHLPKYAVHSLFGGCRRAWRVAGLPNPGEEATTYMT